MAGADFWSTRREPSSTSPTRSIRRRQPSRKFSTAPNKRKSRARAMLPTPRWSGAALQLLITTPTRPVSPFSLLCLRSCPPARASVLVSQMTELVLKKIKHFGAAPWLEKEDDFLVLDDTDRIIGRIVMRARSPKGRPWFWIITAREQPPSFSKNNQGYSESCEQAMKGFEAQYSCVEFHRLVSLLD
jgi:hypothetical protein